MRMLRFLVIAALVVIGMFLFTRFFLQKFKPQSQAHTEQVPTQAQREARQKLEQQLIHTK